MTVLARPKWDDDELEWARSLWADGDSVREISEAAGRGVVDVARALGIDKGRPMRQLRDLTRRTA